MYKYNFKDILEKEIHINNRKPIVFEKIEIPMIQRDYAQGRENEAEIRNRFLDAIFESLVSTNELNLDFVYGSISDSSKTFIPLDGQQRLTTLFLLYWYIGTQELKDKETELNILMGLLKKFTYETRVSSRRFCEKLVETKLDFKKSPKEEITNLYWFFKSYKKDPSVNSMLNMLNSIHTRYIELGEHELYKQLSKLQFYLLPLNGFNLTEELYVKMNARGKQLTDFENFKADLTKWMKSEKNPYREDFSKEIFLNGRKMPYYLSFSQKIDNEWTNFFWKITKDYDTEEIDKKGEKIYPDGKIVDPLFLRFFYRYFSNLHITHSKSDSKIVDKELDYQILSKEDKYRSFNSFQKILVTENELTSFERCFDLLTSNWDKISTAIQPSWPLSNKWTFCDRNFTQSDRIVFLGVTLYLKNNDFDEITFKQWMRIVWNIVENTDITDVSSMIGVMKLLSELSEHSNNIYTFLGDQSNPIVSPSSKNIVIEERIKSRFVVSDSNWEETFINSEKHSFFRGSVGFIMTDEMTINEFSKRAELATKVFDSKGVNEEYQGNGHIFLRALISRYKDNNLIGQNFTDIDEGEHYLKKMLSSNETIRNATREWFNLESDSKLLEKLNDEINKKSIIPGWLANDANEKTRILRAHEALYKDPGLQRWMQQNDAIRFAWKGNHLWISRPRSWHDWVMLDSNRNDLIKEMINLGFTTDQQIGYSEDDHYYKIDFYCGGYILVSGKVDNYEIKLTFNNDKTLTIEALISGEWENIKDYDYCDESIRLSECLNEEIFNKENLEKLIENLK